jgi:hypothetical protein
MGARGPIRNPNSRRGQQEIRKQQRLMAADAARVVDRSPAPEMPADLPTCDPKLPRRVREIYQNLVIWATAAKNQLKQVDSIGLTQVARKLWAIEKSEAIAGNEDAPPEQVLAALKHMDTLDKGLPQWLHEMGLTPRGRAALGLKAAPERKLGPLAQLIAAKQGRKA